ncbi:glycerophosphoryl diester phosphodiesterase membrane domain-containing protein [Haloimpatiens sp. FM7330]|uniref:glycerophosphoryl diester phosphodiesterase membrane domain-containing protein n=1 Tax=Haloimpatiens sp. FM7330 TaxID=3298610 RepID=UPI003634A853
MKIWKNNSKLSFRRLLIEGLKDLKKGFYINLKYEGIYKLLTSFIILPFISLIMNYFIWISGYKVITNKELVKFAFSIPGFITIIILFLISSIAVLLEIGGLIVISQETYFNDRTNIITVLINVAKNIPKILSIGGIQILIYMAVIVPFTGIGASSSLIGQLKIPGFIEDFLINTSWGIILLVVVILCVYFLLIRWIFAFHVSILEGKNFSKALKRSVYLVKGQYFRILRIIFSFHMISLIFTVIFFIIYLLLLSFSIQKFGSDSFISLIVLSFFSVIAGIIFMITSLFTLPFNISVLTRLYYERVKNKDNIEVQYNKKKIYDFKVPFKKLWNKHSNKLAIAAVVIVLVFTTISSLLLYYEDDEKNKVSITAHRGNSIAAPENTLSALKYAMESGANYSEIDVQETKDGKVVLTHDSNLKRISGKDVNIWDINYNDLQKLDVGSWFDSKFKGERMPTLEQAINKVRGKMKLNIEIKLNGHESHLIENVVKIIEKHKFTKNCVVTSLDYDVLKKVRKLNPSIKIGYIMYVVFGDISKLNVDFYSVEATNINEKFITKAHLIGREVHAWTINEELDMENMINLGVDNIITDYPNILKDVLKERKNKSIFEKLVTQQ